MDKNLQEVLNKYTTNLLVERLEEADEEETRRILQEIAEIQSKNKDEEKARKDDLERLIGFAPYRPSIWMPRAKYVETELKKLIHVGESNTGADIALLTTQEINILETETTEWGTRLLVEFKWWFGEKVSEARWQKITIRTYNDLPDGLVYLQLYYTILAARERIASITGVSQDVRH